MATAHHPYVPQDLVLPGFVPNVLPYEAILGVFFGCSALVVIFMFVLTGRFKYLGTVERLWAGWWMCTGLIHFVIEGNVVANSKFYQDTSGNILNEIWKEYTKADSRYATRDAFIVQMEGVTAFVWGPACFLIVYGILYRRAWRFTAMLLVSLGQLYGDVLYYLTCMHEGLTKHTRTEPLYFWGYFVGANAIWIVVPSLCILYCARNVNAAVAAAGKTSTKKSAQKRA
ncbi:3-beta-hydroxysteroid-Delta(8),Delta(7)-isomerase [Tetrabaena socialis]|uniref:3-beta-hydroxysteroid-Delta(8), Delta(7)-isomerase n=1 Tax=Tetrabaena socialis TaxID=47790 RepID=A0A2J8AK31_9CHLO|nr:3-beta-hydroxysteroid-Delta(8),Delta(7)-isomerase [Tetrabaena socialis]|eukprot:PNH12882.1 3-beta-hydroxysteroid-Delta(8),Delta(7)-isomerase [Tetrabaena socialis]